MTKKFFFIVLVAGLLVPLVTGFLGCGGGGNDDSDNDNGGSDDENYPSGQLDTTTVEFQSSTLSSPSELMISNPFAGLAIKSQTDDAEPIENCTVIVPGDNGGEFDGACLTPINVTGAAASVSIGADSGGMEGPARLLGATVGNIGLDRNGELEVFPFDFGDPVGMPGNSNVADNSGENTFDLLRVDVAFFDVKVEVPRSGDATEYWTIRWGFITNPVSDTSFEEGTPMANCVDDGYLAAIEENGLLEGRASFNAGDLMVCQKDTVEEECAEEDFQWFDEDADSFVSTRPANPLQHEWAGIADISCDAAQVGYDITLGNYDFFAVIDNAFTLGAEYQQCQQVYTSGSTTGNTLNVTMDFDMSQAIFINGIIGEAEVEAASDAAIFQAVEFKQIFIRSRQPDPTAITDDLSGGMTAEATISITNDETLACPTIDDIDSRLVADPDSPCTPDAEVDIDCAHEVCTGYSAIDEGEENIWSESTYGQGGSCDIFCTKQTCDSYNGAFKAIYCIPECGGEGDDDNGGEGEGDEGEGEEGVEPQSCEECLEACESQDLADEGETCEEVCAEEFPDLCS